MQQNERSKQIRISIHSLVKRETAKAGEKAGNGANFNPLPRKEGDEKAADAFDNTLDISIHSLVKRETRCSCQSAKQRRYFNPLPRKEGDDNPDGEE